MSHKILCQEHSNSFFAICSKCQILSYLSDLNLFDDADSAKNIFMANVYKS